MRRSTPRLVVTLWSEREKIFYGLDQKLFPGARYVDITQVTPSTGSVTLTYVEVRTAGSNTLPPNAP